jgi:DNA-binding GntR family transcriptional regulator
MVIYHQYLQHILKKQDHFSLQQVDSYWSGSLILSDKAYHLIKHQIVTLELPPSSLIDEQRLTQELGIGRTPVREALRQLAAEKLVTVVPRRGTFVADISITDLHELWEVRWNLEGLAARLAAQRIGGQQLEQMKALFDDFDQVVNESGGEAFLDIDDRFHHLLYQAANNKFLEDVLDRLYTLSARLWFMSLERLSHQVVKEAIREHTEVVVALEKGDAEEAERVIQRHIATFQEKMRAAL